LGGTVEILESKSAFRNLEINFEDVAELFLTINV
jgi:hypothetical protein